MCTSLFVQWNPCSRKSVGPCILVCVIMVLFYPPCIIYKLSARDLKISVVLSGVFVLHVADFCINKVPLYIAHMGKITSVKIILKFCFKLHTCCYIYNIFKDSCHLIGEKCRQNLNFALITDNICPRYIDR